MFRAGSPFSGKFVLFKPVLFVQAMPAGSEDAGALENCQTHPVDVQVGGSCSRVRARRRTFASSASTTSTTATARHYSSFVSPPPPPFAARMHFPLSIYADIAGNLWGVVDRALENSRGGV